MRGSDTKWESNFDAFLYWIDPDRERAAHAYEEIRHSLIKIFAWKHCLDAESLADETLNRVISKLPEISQSYMGPPSSYIYAVAKHVLLESEKAQSRNAEIRDTVEMPKGISDQNTETMYRCLERCLSTLDASSRDLIMEYYRESGARKTESRRHLAEELGVSSAALRVRAYRIQVTLWSCIQNCIKKEAPHTAVAE